MVWCGVVWCGVVWCGVMWCGMRRVNIVSYCKYSKYKLCFTIKEKEKAN